MRLSEAIALGSVILKPVGGTLFADDNNSGCALGMGLAACNQRDTCVLKVWPWLGNDDWDLTNHAYQIAFMFDGKVMKGLMTLEQLCDQVRAWEDELAAKGINVEQVTMAAELNQPASQAAENIPELDVAK